MDDDRIGELENQCRKVVRAANAAGEIDAATFTIAEARKRVAKAMKIDESDLKEQRWKSQFKDVVQKVLESLEDEEPLRPTKSKKAPKQDKPAKDPPVEKKATQKKVRKVRPVDPDEDNHQVAQGEEAKSESEMSSLIDDGPPKKKRKRGSTAASSKQGSGTERKAVTSESPMVTDEDGKPKARSKKSAATSKPGSPAVIQDPRLKELKAIVILCGLRKNWAKEFEGMDTTRKQIAHVKSILAGVGMQGQPTRRKAKAIKEQRELAAELGDIMEFEKKRGLGTMSDRGSPADSTGRPRRAAAKKAVMVTAGDAVSSEEEADSDDEDDESEDAGNEVEDDDVSSEMVEEDLEDAGRAAAPRRRKRTVPSEDDQEDKGGSSEDL